MIVLDKEKKEIVITREQRIKVNEVENIKEIKRQLENELLSIVRQVKQLKARAEEIKTMLNEIEGAGLIDPAPELSQSLPVE